MREIKFRAWSTRLKKHPEYDVFVKKATEEKRIDRNKGTVKQFEDETGNKAFFGEENYMSYDVYVSNEGKSMWLEGGWDYTGDEEKAILMQFTGLKDKNGKEIYEGDILKCERNYWENTRNLVVEWQEERYGLTDIKNPVDSEIMDRTSIFNVPENQREIIGNIYENPELIK